ncbi:hypothetical protein, partial [Stenotrophomonas sp.]|uniref:hypothetical protein n=1 Tax=Stenotrophomonas sp. TaxID=69392 RepID=UPI0025F89FC5
DRGCMKKLLVPSVIGCLLAIGAIAQTTGSKPAPKPPAAASVPALSSPVAGATPSGGLVFGSGRGVHSPDSLFAPLKPRDDVVPWELLADVKTRGVKNRLLPVFKPAQTQLHQKTQRIQGFMMPLEPGERQTHFLLSAVPLTCPFCVPGGPESMVEVRSRTPVKATNDPVVMQGRFLVLEDDAYGLYYRLTDAAPVE